MMRLESRRPKTERRSKSEVRSPQLETGADMLARLGNRGAAGSRFRCSVFGFASGFEVRVSGFLLLACALLAGPFTVCADSLELTPVADTTLAEVAPDNNLGGADFFNSGTAGNRRSNRALLRFDLSTLPAGAVVQSAALVFDVVREPEDGLEPSSFELHRALVSWGEGTGVSDPLHPGRGELAKPGESTWRHRFAGTSLAWAAPGGASGLDFVADSSAEMDVIGINDSPYTLAGTSRLLADLDFWRAHPEANFGWFWLSASEGVQYTARSFGSREGLSPAVLRLQFTVPEPAPFSLLLLGLSALALRRRL
jgi:hypothetical protein